MAARTASSRGTTRRMRVPTQRGQRGPWATWRAHCKRAGAAWVYDGGAGQQRRAAASVSPFRAEVGDLRSLRPTRGHFRVMASRSPPGAPASTYARSLGRGEEAPGERRVLAGRPGEEPWAQPRPPLAV